MKRTGLNSRNQKSDRKSCRFTERERQSTSKERPGPKLHSAYRSIGTGMSKVKIDPDDYLSGWEFSLISREKDYKISRSL